LGAWTFGLPSGPISSHAMSSAMIRTMLGRVLLAGDIVLQLAHPKMTAVAAKKRCTMRSLLGSGFFSLSEFAIDEFADHMQNELVGFLYACGDVACNDEFLVGNSFAGATPFAEQRHGVDAFGAGCR
jgi:hypothetical protein